jgi:hypothetical protein
MSWGVPVTVVELVPSVPSQFSYVHAGDDARRYLERVDDDFDVMIIDPSPPVKAAASSLLYSPEFYEIARRRLRPGGILHQWLPVRSPWWFHLPHRPLASASRRYACSPLSKHGVSFPRQQHRHRTGDAWPTRGNFTPGAAWDLLEWGPFQITKAEIQAVVNEEVPLGNLISAAPGCARTHRGRPVNEYCFLHRR